MRLAILKDRAHPVGDTLEQALTRKDVEPAAGGMAQRGFGDIPSRQTAVMNRRYPAVRRRDDLVRALAPSLSRVGCDAGRNPVADDAAESFESRSEQAPVAFHADRRGPQLSGEIAVGRRQPPKARRVT